MLFLASNMRQLGHLARGVYTPGPFGGHATLANSIVSYWKFDETSGTTLNDEVGSNDGTLTGGTVNNTGVINKCVYLDGSGDYISFGNDSSLSKASRSYSLWFKSYNATNPSDYKGLIFKQATATTAGREVGLIFKNSGGSLMLQVSDDIRLNYAIQPSTDYYDGNWHHAVITIAEGASSDTVTLYIDGASKGSDSTASGHAAINTNDLEMGRVSSASSAGRYFNGWLDEVGVWGRALTLAEVQALYNSGSGLSY